MRCSKCGMTLPDDSIFCSGCGSEIKMKKVICWKCGTELTADSEFCNRCGTSVKKPSKKGPEPVRERCPNCGISLTSEQKYCPKCKERNPIYINSNKQKNGNRKKLIGWLSAAAGLLAVVAIVVFGFIIPEGHYEFEYEMINDGENYAIIGYYGKESDVVIPKTIWWKPVTMIAGYAFQNRGDITSVNINADISGIGVSAFEGCSHLFSVKIGDNNVTSYATNGVIMESAFKGCNNLKTITFTGSRSYSVLDDCFDNCYSLSKIVFEDYDGIYFYKIGERAFRDCRSLSSLNLSCEEIGAEAFSGCTGIVSATASVPVIPESCFENCTSLEKFVGRNVEMVAPFAFSNCVNLSAVIYESDEAPIIFDLAYDGCPKMMPEPEPEAEFQFNPYAGSNLIGMTKQEMFDYLGYNYELKNVLGGLFYLYDQYGLSIPVDEESVYINNVYVYGDQYVSSMEGVTDHIRIGMTIGEIFDIVGELPISADMMTGGYYFSIEQNGYCCQFITEQTDDEVIWGMDGTITFNKTDAFDDVVSYCLIYRIRQ